MKPSDSDEKVNIQVVFRPDGKKVQICRGSTLLEAAAAAGIALQSSCGGRGACGKCKVRLISPDLEPTPEDIRHFNQQELEQGYRLACKTLVAVETEVEIPQSSLLMREKISLEGLGRKAEVEPSVRKVFLQLPPPSLTDQRADLIRLTSALGNAVKPPADLSLLQELPGRLRKSNFAVTAVLADGNLVDLESGDTTEEHYGLAVDIGTTTIVGYLSRLDSGMEVAVGSMINPQTQHGDDVISRISFASGTEQGLSILQEKVVGAINSIISEVCREGGVERRNIYELTAVGNTCMTHLLLGINPASLATMPYVAVNTAAMTIAAKELGIEINPRGRVYILPNIGGFVGADTVGVIVASALEEERGISVAVDIGTNGEVVAVKDGHMLACSTAAGPAFEGARISQGMRAASGAIDQVVLADGELQIHTIDETPARGICGSGLVDAIAAMLELGIITSTGRLLGPDAAPDAAGKFVERLDTSEALPRFILVAGEESATGEPIYITSRDVRELQLAKGALCSGILMLLHKLGTAPSEVGKILLAGAFGNYIRRESAIAIGLLPDLPLERIEPIGNAAGVGAHLALVSAGLRGLAEEAARSVEYVELSEQAEFNRLFAEAMTLAPVSEWNRDND